MRIPSIPYVLRLLKQQGKSDWRLIQVGTVTLALMVVVLSWVFTFQRMAVETSQALASAATDQQNLAAVMAENLSHVLDRAQLMARSTRFGPNADMADAARQLGKISNSDHLFLGHALYDAQGQRVYSSPAFQDSAELSRSVRELLAAPGMGLHQALLPPLSTQDERAWQLPLLTTLPGTADRPVGVLVVQLDMGYFLRFYRDIELGSSGTLLVLDSRGKVLVEARPQGLMMQTTVQRLSLTMTDGLDSGALRGEPFEDGRTFLSAFRRPAGEPFVVVISRDIQDILDSHPRTQPRFLWIMGLFSVLVLAVAWGVSQSMRKREQDVAKFVRADREKSQLIAEIEEEKRRAFVLASHDHLTGLHNRRMFNELLDSHLYQANRNRQHYALMFLDLDRFKSINDNLGHHVGDLLLQEVAARLRASLRESDVLARLGGDEFAILLTSLDRIEDCTGIADKLVEAICQPYPDLDGNTVQISPSVGIAAYPRDGADGITLFRNADAAMYRSKELGRGKYTFYDPALNAVGSRLFDLEQRLPKAIANNELVLHFQPKVRLMDYKIIGFEALVRWQHPELGLIYPNEFIPAAEESGLIASLGDWVAQHCCLQLNSWQEKGLALVPIAYNVSARQLHNSDLPQQLARQLAEHQLRAELLEVEITETSLVESMDQAKQVLGELEALGVHISLDDFGSGFSGLDYVRSFPIHKIKIDRSFVSDIRNRQDAAVIVTSIITMAHNLKMSVVAEGVETKEQLIHLRTAGCDEAQGYFFSRPVPAPAATELLKRIHLVPA